MKIFSLCALMTISFAAPAMARDSTHLVCSGFMTTKPGPDNYGLSIQFDEWRFGEGRLETLSAIWQTNLYQGQRQTNGERLGHDGQIVLAAREFPTRIFFTGKYNLIKSRSGAYQMQLEGNVNLDPLDRSSPTDTLKTMLHCVDISN